MKAWLWFLSRSLLAVGMCIWMMGGLMVVAWNDSKNEKFMAWWWKKEVK